MIIMVVISLLRGGNIAKYIKDIVFGNLARQKLLEGMEILAKAVASTLGPRSRTVAIDITANYDVAPTILKDGVGVARSINLKDVHQDMGARLLKQAALKTVKDVGDGTTLTTILAYAIVKEALKAIASGVNPMQIKQEVEEAAKFIVASLQKLAVKISKYEEKEQIATISSADPEIGKLVAEALEKVGKEGVITVEEGTTLETTIDYKQGMEIDRGYMSTYFVTDQERGESIIEDPYILITDRNINYTHEILPFLENFTKETGSKNLVIFAGALIEEAMGIIAANKIRGVLNICAIQSPAFGTRRADELEDIATLTGGTTILADSGRGIASVIPQEL